MIELHSTDEGRTCDNQNCSSSSPTYFHNVISNGTFTDSVACKTSPFTECDKKERCVAETNIASLSRDVILHDNAFLTLLRTTQVNGDAFPVVSICDMYLKASSLDVLHRIRLDVANTVLAFMVMRGHENRDRHIAIVLDYQKNCRLLYQSLIDRGDEFDYDRELRLELARTALEVVQNLQPGASLEDASAMFGECGKRDLGPQSESRKRSHEHSELLLQNLQVLPLHTNGSKRRRISLWVSDVAT
ncbi:hypothetical protein SARC_13505 [Sphaeroforma arctica JP610]|uniref:Uncharacterized protein n=1 Tax=Sphaeroforma arctica JP610 TaxID=667725 RepID=A0A0L0FBR1_9EUKA|nr:hypothetical protein SARC_13505 [Sphaeroforma arctica JP610]KNC73936.1 hypothetical protein SARC_13505 [Sphaeroforma arctica JP610]|eukprot:XP_014147838.1 hypothetical protein SARC_13505 [Sphaeroforma arctica JP610]